MTGAGTGVAEAGADAVVDEVAGVSCMGAESLGTLWEREQPSIKGGANFSGSQGGCSMPGRGAGLLENTESSSAISWCRSLSHPSVGRRLVECCCLRLPMKSLGDRCRSTSGWR